MIRINVPILANLDPNYEENLVQKAANHYLEKKRYSTKSKVSKKSVQDTVPITSGYPVTPGYEYVKCGYGWRNCEYSAGKNCATAGTK